MPKRVWSSPVISPVTTPASSAASSAAQAGQPANSSMTVTAPPVAKEPSTVRSAMSSTRKVRNTPKAIRPQSSPWAAAAGIRENS